jgi:predicted aminopeptidase
MKIKIFKLFSLLCFSFFFIFINFSCIGYIAHVSFNHLKLIWNRRPIPEVIKDPKTDKAILEKLTLIPKVQNFAINNLGLKKSKSYLYFTEVNRDYVAYNVSACHQLKFEPHTWYFPIIGSVPYKGYFDLEMARKEYQELKEMGWDARLRGVRAYSTLGWFDDPVLSRSLVFYQRFREFPD